MKFILHILSSISPLLFFFGGFTYSLLYQNNFGYYFSFMVLFLGELGGRFLKSFFKSVFPNKEWMERPNQNAPCTFFLTKHSKPSWGFPSGHAHTTSFSLTLLLLYLWKLTNEALDKKIFFTMIALLFIMYVSWSRISLECHNKYQVLAGITSGFILGVYAYFLYVNFQNLASPEEQ